MEGFERRLNDVLDELIARWVEASTRSHDRVVALRLQRIARVVVIPAAALMLAGLVAFAVTAQGGEPAVLPLSALFSRAAVSPVGAMSVGLLALVLLPVINVLYILADRVATKRWLDAAAATLVAGILILGIFLGRK
ncbi:MAG: DUF1634 domain-containing protein [Anaerolineae bacterium]|nr:DUF1634 domain-containing protein [Anaerolineae bacterium]